MRATAWLIAIGLSTVTALNASADVKKMSVKSKITHVTLYRSQALITRNISVPNKTGELALLIEKLPSSIVPGSLFASSKDLKVRSVRYLTELIPQKLPTDKIAQLEAKVTAANVAKLIISNKMSLLEEKKGYLISVERQYIAKLGPSKTAITEEQIAISGFDFNSISKMTDFIFKQLTAITNEKLKFDAETRKLDTAIKKYQQQLNALRYGNPEGTVTQRAINRNVIHKAIVYVAKLKAGKSTLSLSYLVNNAGWRPAYNMRISGKGNKLNLEYLAHVRQLSREDWNGVKLTLSTATPNMNAEIPILAPMWVRLTESGKRKKYHFSINTSNQLAKNFRSQMQTISQFQQRSGKDGMNYNLALNSGAWNRQKLEFSNDKKVLLRWKEGVRKIEQQMAVEYRISDTVTLASRDDNQMVQILSKSLSCSLYYEAVPLLAGYVSRGIESKNTINQPLLAGKYSAFVDGQYVGSGTVPVTATGQTMDVGLGIDPQLRCRRELTDKLADKSWGSRTETYKYCMTLENYKSTQVKIRLLDRIPVTKNKELEITLKTGGNKLSKDADYREFDLPKGILRWDITLPASSSGAKATKLDYSFDMKFDSDMQISGFGNQMKEKLRYELMNLKMRKQRK